MPDDDVARLASLTALSGILLHHRPPRSPPFFVAAACAPRTCLVHQKLQMLNCCVAELHYRRQSQVRATSPVSSVATAGVSRAETSAALPEASVKPRPMKLRRRPWPLSPPSKRKPPAFRDIPGADDLSLANATSAIGIPDQGADGDDDGDGDGDGVAACRTPSGKGVASPGAWEATGDEQDDPEAPSGDVKSLPSILTRVGDGGDGGKGECFRTCVTSHRRRKKGALILCQPLARRTLGCQGGGGIG